MPSDAVYRVAHVDAVPLFQHGVAGVLGRDARLQWVGSASSAGGAVQLCRAAAPHVVLMDADVDQGANLCRLLTSQHRGLTVIMLFRQGARAAGEVDAARRAGARGFLPREIDPVRLPDAICLAMQTGFYADPAVAPVRVPDQADGRPAPPPLSRRELEVLRLIADGMTARRIASRLELSEETVKTHVRRMLRKLEARDRAHAVALAFQSGVLAGRPPTFRAG